MQDSAQEQRNVEKNEGVSDASSHLFFTKASLNPDTNILHDRVAVSHFFSMSVNDSSLPLLLTVLTFWGYVHTTYLIFSLGDSG